MIFAKDRQLGRKDSSRPPTTGRVNGGAFLSPCGYFMNGCSSLTISSEVIKLSVTNNVEKKQCCDGFTKMREKL